MNESLKRGASAAEAHLNAAQVVQPGVGAHDFPASLGYTVYIAIDVVSGEISGASESILGETSLQADLVSPRTRPKSS